jgi:DNA-binding FadR family transcriptional regulator
MELTTGAILRRITETPLSTAAHKLATIILDGIAWKDGYNGLERGTAAFTLAHLAEKMGVSRQHLTALLVELAASGLALVRWKPNGKFAPWLFRFGGAAMSMRCQMSCQPQATHHYLESLRTKLSLQERSRSA